ncbi:MAG: regulatory protein RecX [Clostridia bacterium]|nr:regulatory protein RecX [Clostridia bacterium]
MRRKETLNTYEAVKEKALRLLEFRSHSEHELSQKLRLLGAKQEHIEAVLDFCREYGFVDDKAYASRKAADLFRLKKFGRRRIENELRSLGIPDEYIILDELDPDEERDNLRALAEKKLGGDYSQKSRDRCIRFLAYRGYDYYDIKDVMEEFHDV